MQTKKQLLLKKLIFRSNYMGCKENDIIFGSFASKLLETLSKKDLENYDQLMKINDDLLLAWMHNRQSPPRKFRAIIHKIQKFTIK